MRHAIADKIGTEEVLCQLAEEAAELAQAALKLRRVMDGTNPSPISMDYAVGNLNEELGDVLVCVSELSDIVDIGAILDNAEIKLKRWRRRIDARMGGNL